MRPAFSQAATNIQKNILGTTLQLCCNGVGYNRDGYCRVPRSDSGNHSVCAIVTDEFLQYSRLQGNDLITPMPPYFPGLKDGDKWCLCAGRWLEAYEAGVAPPVVLEATSEAALQKVTLEQLQQHAVANSTNNNTESHQTDL